MISNDLHLFHQAQSGSMSAFEILFRRYYNPLCSYAYRFTDSPDFSEELVQELFYVLWRDRAELNIERSVKSYLYEAVRNRAFHFLERRRVKERYSKMVKMEVSVSPSPETDVEGRDMERRVSEILLRFPDRRRRIFCMHRFGGNKYDEIADKLSVSVKTVEAEMHKALKALRTGLSAG